MKTKLILALIFAFILASPPALAATAVAISRTNGGVVVGRIKGGVAAAAFPVPQSTVLAYGLYHPGYRGAAKIATSGKFRISNLAPGPYVLFFDVWAKSKVWREVSPLLIWVDQGTPTPELPDTMGVPMLKVSSFPWKTTSGVILKDKKQHPYDYRSLFITDLMAESDGKAVVIEENGSAGYTSIGMMLTGDSTGTLDIQSAASALDSVGPDLSVLGQIASANAASVKGTANGGVQNTPVISPEDALASLVDPVTTPVRKGQRDAMKKMAQKLQKKIRESIQNPMPLYYNGTYMARDSDYKFAQGYAAYAGKFTMTNSGTVSFARRAQTYYDVTAKATYQVYQLTSMNYDWKVSGPTTMPPGCNISVSKKAGIPGSTLDMLLIERTFGYGDLAPLTLTYNVYVSYPESESGTGNLVCGPVSMPFDEVPVITLRSGPPGSGWLNPGDISIINGTWTDGSKEWTWSLQGSDG